MSHILNIKNSFEFDESITNIQHHSYNPYTNTYNNSEEIRIVIQQQDLYVLPHDSYLYIEGNVRIQQLVATATAEQRVCPNFVNNAAAFLFDEIRYELNGYEIDRCKNVGITTSMKGYTSFIPDDLQHMEIAGWDLSEERAAKDSLVNYCIPLKNIFGFFEDYRNIILNAKHELIILRSRTDTNAFVGDNDIAKINISKIQWRIPHVYVSDTEKLKLLKYIKRKQPIPLNYRSFELYEHPTLPQTDKHIWSVKTSSQINTPRYIIIGFQTNRNNRIKANKSCFDHCKLQDLKVFLNSVCYPYDNLNIDFAKDQYAILYDMFARFQKTFYHERSYSCPLLSYKQFKDISPLIVIDCSRQNESLKASVIDIRIEMQTRANIEQNTTGFCMIVHDNVVTYNPYTNIVNRMV